MPLQIVIIQVLSFLTKIERIANDEKDTSKHQNSKTLLSFGYKIKYIISWCCIVSLQNKITCIQIATISF